MLSVNGITVLGVEFEILKLFETYYRYKMGRRTTTMFETYELMYLQGIRESSGFAPTKLKSELISLMNKDISPDKLERQIAVLFTLFEMYVKFRDEFKIQLETMCNEFQCSFRDFILIMYGHKNEASNDVNVGWWCNLLNLFEMRG